MEWRKPLIIGGKANGCMNVRSVVKKGFEGAVPMVFVNQGIEISNEGDEGYAILEERTHVYLALGVKQRKFREGKPACAYIASNETNVICSAWSATPSFFTQIHAESHHPIQILRIDIQRPPHPSRPRLCA